MTCISRVWVSAGWSAWYRFVLEQCTVRVTDTGQCTPCHFEKQILKQIMCGFQARSASNIFLLYIRDGTLKQGGYKK